MNLFFHFILSFMASVGFALVFNSPRKSLLQGGIAGGLGWTIYTALQNQGIGSVGANLIASCFVAVAGELFARLGKRPVTIFVIPGIIPLVPGYSAYMTMLNLVLHQYDQGIRYGIAAFSNAGAIALGIILVSSISRMIKEQREKGVWKVFHKNKKLKNI